MQYSIVNYQYAILLDKHFLPVSIYLSICPHPSISLSPFSPSSAGDRWGIELSALVDRAYLRRVNPRNFIGNAPRGLTRARTRDRREFQKIDSTAARSIRPMDPSLSSQVLACELSKPFPPSCPPPAAGMRNFFLSRSSGRALASGERARIGGSGVALFQLSGPTPSDSCAPAHLAWVGAKGARPTCRMYFRTSRRFRPVGSMETRRWGRFFQR